MDQPLGVDGKAYRCEDERGEARTGRWPRGSGGTATLRRCPPRSGVLARARFTVRDSAATRSAAPSSWISRHAGTCQYPGTRKRIRAERHSGNWLIAWLAARCPNHGGGIP